MQVSYTSHKKEEKNRSQHQWLREHEYWVEVVVDLQKNMPKSINLIPITKQTAVRKSRELLHRNTHTSSPPRPTLILFSKVGMRRKPNCHDHTAGTLNDYQTSILEACQFRFLAVGVFNPQRKGASARASTRLA